MLTITISQNRQFRVVFYVCEFELFLSSNFWLYRRQLSNLRYNKQHFGQSYNNFFFNSACLILRHCVVLLSYNKRALATFGSFSHKRSVLCVILNFRFAARAVQKMANQVPFVQFNNGQKFPIFGLGTWKVSDRNVCIILCKL